MSISDNPQVQGVVRRARALMVTPAAEWDLIAVESASIRSLYVPYVMLLAAIGPVCTLIGFAIFGYPVLGQVTHVSVFSLIGTAVVSYVLSLLGVFIMALIIEAVSPYFGGAKDRIAAFKLAAYFPTAWWLADVFNLFPPLAMLQIIGFYSLYTLYRGVPRVMRAPADKAVLFTLVVIIVAIIVYLIMAIVGSAVGMTR
jgi:hypothetical protein